TDMLVCRYGASKIAVFDTAGKPTLFIPFPRSAYDHQKLNGQALELAGAAVMLEESNLTGERLVELLSSLLQDGSRLDRMGAAARRLSHPEAARDIAAMAARLAGVGTQPLKRTV